MISLIFQKLIQVLDWKFDNAEIYWTNEGEYYIVFQNFLFFYLTLRISIMRILTVYAPLLKVQKTFVARNITCRLYHSAEYSGGGLMGGRDNFNNHIPTPIPKGPGDPFSHLEFTQLTDPRSVSTIL